jgi:hypothetical protein
VPKGPTTNPSHSAPPTATVNKPSNSQNQDDLLKALAVIALLKGLGPKQQPAPQPSQPPPGYAQSIYGGLTPRGSLFDISTLLQNPGTSTQIDRQRQGQYGRAAQVYGAYAGLAGSNALFDAAAQGLP